MFIEMSLYNGVEIKEYNDMRDFFDKIGYEKSVDFYLVDKVGVVKALSANARGGNVLIDTSTLEKLRCIVDVEKLFVLVERDKIFESAYEAYSATNRSDYMIFVGAESKTADIEKQLISGVQGAEKVVFVLI